MALVLSLIHVHHCNVVSKASLGGKPFVTGYASGVSRRVLRVEVFQVQGTSVLRHVGFLAVRTLVLLPCGTRRLP